MATASEVFIARALSFEGYVEGPRSNETPFGARTGHQFEPWCDSFVSCVAGDVWLSDVIPESVYVPGRLAAARASGQVVTSPRRGDLVCFDWQHDGTADHIGIVLAVNGQTLATIEGNTAPNDAGSQSNGGGVYMRTRYTYQVGGFIRPPYPSGEWTVPTPAEIAASILNTPLPNGQANTAGAPITVLWALSRIYDASQKGSPVTLSADQVTALAAAAGGLTQADVRKAVADLLHTTTP